MKYFRTVLWTGVTVAAIAATVPLTGCAVAVISGAVGAGTLIVTAGGRRDSETAQADDRIENQAGDAIEKALDGRDHHVIVVSYFRKVLLAGEVSSDADRARAQALAQGVQGVQGVVNDLAVMPPAGALTRSQDAYITSKIKARLLNTNGVPAANVKVLTERGTVYLMGRLTRLEAQVTTDAVQQVDGVQRVARVIDIILDAGMTDGSTSTITGGGGSTDAPASGGNVAGNGAQDSTAPVSTPSVKIHPVEMPSIQPTTAAH